MFATNEESIPSKDDAIEVQNAFSHVDLGLGPFPLPLPSFALGHRNQWGHHSFDATLSVVTVIEITQVKASMTYLYCSKPNLKSQFYIGPGLGVSSFFWGGKIFMGFSPELIFGKEYSNFKDGLESPSFFCEK